MTSHRLKAALLLAASLAAAALPALAAPGAGTWIDVRSASEYADGHVAIAVNIPYEDITAGVAALDPPKDQPIYLYCRSGRRAGIAREALLEAGYTNVTNLGGLDDAREHAGERIRD